MNLSMGVAIPAICVTVPVLASLVVACLAWRRATNVVRRSNMVAAQISALRREFVESIQPSALFADPAFDQRLTAFLRPLLRAEAERFRIDRPPSSAVALESGPQESLPAVRSLNASEPDSGRLTDSQLQEVCKALAETLRSGGGVLDPDGFVELAVGDVLARVKQTLAPHVCAQAIRQLNRCFGHSSHGVLRQKNFLRIRHLRSLSGEPNLRVGILLEAVSPFLDESLKG